MRRMAWSRYASFSKTTRGSSDMAKNILRTVSACWRRSASRIRCFFCSRVLSPSPVAPGRERSLAPALCFLRSRIFMRSMLPTTRATATPRVASTRSSDSRSASTASKIKPEATPTASMCISAIMVATASACAISVSCRSPRVRRSRTDSL